MIPAIPIHFSPAIATARNENRPIVALESTIITHGMPWPQNVETARKIEAIVRDNGAEPATIAVIDGKIHIGLEDSQLEILGQARDVMKLSRADFAFALAQNRTGSTTVAATMIAAHMAKIKIFATGGIGGVHRGASQTFDISADLDELSRTPITVVSAGAKAILDIKKTLEVLETKGVPVITYQSDTLPAFWSRDSGIPASLRADTPKQLAQHARMRTVLGGGTLIANPVPKKAEIPRLEMEIHIATALKDADKNSISAKAVTPYLLGRILELTQGKSLATNIALVANNAKLAAQIAVEDARL